MDKDLARILATSGTQAAQRLTDLVPLLAEHLPDDRALRVGIASAIFEVMNKVVQPAFDAFPDLDDEFEKRRETYGRST